MAVIFSVVSFALMVGVLIDIIILDASKVRFLGKGLWIILVILLPLVGSVLWLAIGREYSPVATRGSVGSSFRRTTPSRPVHSQPDFVVRDAEAELAALDREIAAHEREMRIRELEAELKAKRRNKDSKH